MHFTNGYWVNKPEYILDFATEAYRVNHTEDALKILATSKPALHDRGAVLNLLTFNVSISIPAENVFRVEIVHHAGVQDKGPHFGLNHSAVPVEFAEDDEKWTISGGDIRAEVSKKPWGISFYGGDRQLTSTGYHGIAHAYENAITHYGEKTYMIDSLFLDVGEWVYGLGERFTPYIKNGQSVDMWNADGGTASQLAYKNIPFYMTNRGYGVFVDDTSDVSFEIASEKVQRVQFSVEGEKLVYYIIYGPTPKQILNRYTALTGRPALPPAWSFGLWLSTSFTTNYDEATTSSFINGMLERDIPLSVFHFDCYWMKGQQWCNFEWDGETFPDPEDMLKRYKNEKGLRICVWMNPYIAQDSRLFAEGVEKGYFIKKENGDVWQTDMWQAGMAILDVTNPEAKKWYQGYLKNLLDMGVDCLKTDFGERIPVTGVKYYDGSDPLHMHNYYCYLYNQMVFELLEEQRGKGEAVLFARSATVGGQKFPCHWGGDNTANYLSMAETLRAGLSMAHSGFGFWSHDISGFEQTAPAEVYKRWAQFGLLSSHSRLHGSESYRVPWLFDDESSLVVSKFTHLKCKLMPYLFAAAVEAHEQGIPMMRPMILEFPDDLTAQMADRQYMFGGELLVAPVFHASKVDFYLPEGKWINILDGHTVEGGKWIHEEYDFMNMPLFIRTGSVLPMGGRDDRPDYDYADGLELHCYAMQDGDSREITVHDLKGKVQATYKVSCENGEIKVSTDSEKPYKVIVH